GSRDRSHQSIGQAPPPLNRPPSSEGASMVKVTSAARTNSGWRMLTLLALGMALALSTAMAQPYQEAPILAEQVAAGTLPPLEERLPENPLVIAVDQEIGTYGGVLRRGFTGPGDHNNYTRFSYDA